MRPQGPSRFGKGFISDQVVSKRVGMDRSAGEEDEPEAAAEEGGEADGGGDTADGISLDDVAGYDLRTDETTQKRQLRAEPFVTCSRYRPFFHGQLSDACASGPLTEQVL